MIILTESTASQSFEFIPRQFTSGSGESYTISIISETENKEIFTDTATSFATNKYYFVYSNIFTLKQDNFYMLKISASNGDVIFNDKIFCTNQLADQPEIWSVGNFVWNLTPGTWNTTPENIDYSVNYGNYIEHSSNNEFIIL